jgi:hypothetical protein
MDRDLDRRSAFLDNERAKTELKGLKTELKRLIPRTRNFAGIHRLVEVD